MEQGVAIVLAVFSAINYWTNKLLAARRRSPKMQHAHKLCDHKTVSPRTHQTMKITSRDKPCPYEPLNHEAIKIA